MNINGKKILMLSVVKILELLYANVVLPEARKFVSSTDNDYDDKCLSFIDELMRKVIDDLKYQN